MNDQKLNGFNNGRDTTDGVGGMPSPSEYLKKMENRQGDKGCHNCQHHMVNHIACNAPNGKCEWNTRHSEPVAPEPVGEIIHKILPTRDNGLWIDARFGDNWVQYAKNKYSFTDVCNIAIHNGRNAIILQEEIEKIYKAQTDPPQPRSRGEVKLTKTAVEVWNDANNKIDRGYYASERLFETIIEAMEVYHAQFTESKPTTKQREVSIDDDIQVCFGCGTIWRRSTGLHTRCCPDQDYMPITEFIPKIFAELIDCKKRLIKPTPTEPKPTEADGWVRVENRLPEPKQNAHGDWLIKAIVTNGREWWIYTQVDSKKDNLQSYMLEDSKSKVTGFSKWMQPEPPKE